MGQGEANGAPFDLERIQRPISAKTKAKAERARTPSRSSRKRLQALSDQ